jgi:RNA recognition motif-containing protein
MSSVAPNDIFVGNLSANTTEEQLREVFSVVGQIRNIRILMDKDTGRLKGFAFIEYTNRDSVNAAIRLLNM